MPKTELTTAISEFEYAERLYKEKLARMIALAKAVLADGNDAGAAAGTKGKRYALPNSKIMLHQPWGQVPYAQVSDIEITANEFMKDRQRLNEILAKHCNQPFGIIEKETERDRYFHALEAKEFGIVDDVLQKVEPVKKV